MRRNNTFFIPNNNEYDILTGSRGLDMEEIRIMRHIQRHQNRKIKNNQRREREKIKRIANQIEREEKNQKTGCTQEAFQRIPEYRFDKENEVFQSSDVCECSVCMEPFEQGELVKKLKCSHVFHTECIQPWLL